MINETIAITRGSGVFQHEFDFSAIEPPIEVSTDEQWLLRVENSLLPQITKRSIRAGGSDDEIVLDAVNSTVTVILDQGERNSIPDSGYTYKLFAKIEGEDWEEKAYGDITSTGDAPSQEIDPELVKVNAVNGSQRRSVTQNFAFRNNDDYVYADTTLTNIVGTLPNANTFADVKRYLFKNKGSGTLTINDHEANTLIILAEQESCKVATNGTAWEVFFTGVGEIE